MKNIIIIISIFLSSVSLCAQSYEDKQKNDIKYDFSVNLGYDITNNGAILGAKIGFEFFFLRADIDICGAYLDHPLNFEKITTFSPSAGFFYGKNYKVYALIGFQNYAIIQPRIVNEIQTNYFRLDHIYGVTKIGYQHTFDERFFLSLEAHYLFCKQKETYTYFTNTNVRIGVGYRF
ncbi:MAG: outer membrane beta-barrel protein [Alphaproteobacteria bacterium]|nr:outer membrane beta-barrel protein [Alphaproteobacteria bacterium]